MERQHFWGCTLTKDKPEVKWLGTEDIKDENIEVDLVNQLALSQACLGVKADDTLSHVVQVTTTGFNSNKITQPIIVLGCDVKQVQCRLEFSNAATFKLIEGHGPVHLSGNHIQVLSGAYSGSESDDEDADTSLQNLERLELINMKTKPKSSPNKQPPAKKVKLDPVLNKSISDDEEEDDDSEEEEDGEPVELIEVKDAKPSAKIKNQKNVKASEKKKETSKTVEPDADEASDESINVDDSEEDDDNDEDFKAGGSDGGDDDGDDDDDDDDEEDDDDDGSEEDSEIDDDEITNAIAAKKKLRNQKKEVEEKTPSKTTPAAERRTPRKSGLNASLNLQKTLDIATVKQSLLKSPNLPKKMDKFKNFMRMNMKITDEKVVKDLWIWLKKNKK